MTEPKTRRLTAEQRREAILTTATDVFAEFGYQRGKVAEIAARMSVTQPVIFQNFGTKAALYRAVLDRLTTSACDVLAAAQHPGTSVTKLLETTLSPAHLADMHAPGSLGALFADAATLMTEPDVGDAARDAIDRVATALTDLLTFGQQSGDVRSDVDPAAAAWWILSLISARNFRTAVAPAQVETQLVEMTMRILGSSH